MIWAVSLLTTDLITRSLTAVVHVYGIRSLIGFSNCCQPLAHSVLYLHYTNNTQRVFYDASPKAISRRTSYLQVRLEFLRYPQLIPWFFNTNVVRTSTEFYFRFILSMDRSPGFGSTTCNYTPYSDSVSLRLRTLST